LETGTKWTLKDFNKVLEREAQAKTQSERFERNPVSSEAMRRQAEETKPFQRGGDKAGIFIE